MALFLDLFSTDYGLVALAVTLVSLAMAWGFHAFIRAKVRESENLQDTDSKNAANDG